MSPQRTQAIVLRRTNYGEADRIVQFLTPLGRTAVLARGVRRQKSKLAGGIELFAVSDVTIVQGKGKLGTLTSARLYQLYHGILKDYDRLQFGYETLKLVRKASELVDEPDWFEVTVNVLAALDVSSVDMRLTKIWFYLQYSELLGHGLGLHYDYDGKRLVEGERYGYDVGEKALRRREEGDLTSSHLTLLRLAATKPLKSLANVGGLDDVLDVCLQVANQHAAIEN